MSVRRVMPSRDLLAFTHASFKWGTGRDWVHNWHHAIICAALELVYSGEIKRLIINLPPAYSKTQIATINFPALGFARNPAARFILVGYSQDRSYESSRAIRDTLYLPEFVDRWPVSLRQDKNAVGAWGTAKGGALKAASSGGQITGFHAGTLGQTSFGGALVFDDPLKPDDAMSAVKRAVVNDRFISTFRSRLAQENVPIVVIMQRLHDDDLCGFLLRGGSPADRWHHLVLPALNDGPLVYPSDYTHGDLLRIYRPDGPLWPAKHSRETLELLQKSEYVWASQYAQFPQRLGGSLFKSEWWAYYQAYDAKLGQVTLTDGARVALRRKMIYADTAQKTGEQNDYSVFQCWALGEDDRIYLIDQLRGKWTAPDLRVRFLQFCDAHEYKPGVTAVGVHKRCVEDKSSGTGLIQEINAARTRGWVTGIPRDRDKISRAHGVTISMSQRKVVLPIGAPWLEEYLQEFERFSSDMSHAHDDQVDVTMDAITEMLQNKTIDYGKLIGKR